MAVKFSQEVFNTICERIANGESLRSICSNNDMPGRTAFFRWLQEDEGVDLQNQYARAREQQADHYFEQVVEIADTEEDPQRARVMIDARKWVAGKMRPKIYGDRVDHNVGGGINVNVRHQYPEPPADG